MLLGVLITTGILTWLLTTSPVQNWLVKKAATYLSEELETTVSIGRVNIQLFDKIDFNDLYIEDKKGDTLFYFKRLGVDLATYDKKKHMILIDKLDISGAKVYFKIHTGEKRLNYKFIEDYFDGGTGGGGPSWVIKSKKIILKNSAFLYRDYEMKTPDDRRFHENNMLFYDLNATLKNFTIIDDSLNFQSLGLACDERSGLKINDLSAYVTISSHVMRFDNLHLETGHSLLKDFLQFDYSDYSVFDEFIDSVRISTTLKEANVSFRDMAFFSDELMPYLFHLRVSGKATGIISNFKVRNLKIAYSDGTKLMGNVRIKGLPDWETAYFDTDLNTLEFVPDEIQQITGLKNLPSGFYQLGHSHFSGNFSGFYNDFVAFGKLKTELGDLESDFNMKIPDKGLASYSGNLKALNFDIGTFLEVTKAGNANFNLNIVGKGLKLGDFKTTLEGNIANLNLYGYDYKGISIKGLIDKKMFNGKLAVKDDNIDLSFDGNIDFNEKLPRYNFDIVLSKLNLKPLQFDTLDGNISSRIGVTMMGNKLDNMVGNITLTDLGIRRGNAKFKMKLTSFFATMEDEVRTVIFKSDVADMSISGHFDFSKLKTVYKEFVQTIFPELIVVPVKPRIPVTINFAVTIKKPEIISELLGSKLQISSGLIKGEYNSSDESLNFWGALDTIIYDELVIRKLDINMKKQPLELLNLSIESKLITQGGYTRADHVQVNATILSEKVDFTIIASDTSHKTSLFTYAESQITKDTITIKFINGELKTYGRTYLVDNSNLIQIWKGKTSISDFTLTSGNESLSLNSNIYEDRGQQSSLWLNNFDLTALSPIILNKYIESIGGIANGNLHFSGKLIEPMVNSDLLIENLELNGDTLGNFKLITKSREQIYKMDVFCTMQEGLLKDLEISGSLNFSSKEDNLNLRVVWKEGDIKPFEEFFKGVASNFKGNIQASCMITGSFEKPNLGGNINLDNCSFLVDYTNVSYFCKGLVQITENRFAFTDVSITDAKGGIGMVAGFLTHKQFNDFKLDVKLLKLQNIQVLNTTKGSNEMFYGSAFMDGSCEFKGPLDDIYMSIHAKTRKGTKIYIPLETESDNSSSGFISFVKSKEEDEKDLYKNNIEGITMDFNFELTPDAQIELIFDELMDDRIKASGQGNLKMEINTFGDFNMYGDYIIETGQYHFTALNFISKEFIVKNGSSLKWNGSPYDAKLNIEAAKRENAVPADLLVGLIPEEQLADYRTKIPVDCQLFIRGLLYSPEITFGLDFPNQNISSSSSSTAFNSVVRRIQDDPEERNRQVFSLLVLGSFIPTSFATGHSSYSANTGIQNTVNNSVGDLISNQLSNWISQLDDKWQFGIDWQQASEATKQELIFSVKRKFLKDRLEVESSIDANSSAGKNPYNVMVQYNVTPDGRFKVRGFSKFANDPTLGQVSNISTTGVGFFYRIQFDRISFRRKSKTLAP